MLVVVRSWIVRFPVVIDFAVIDTIMMGVRGATLVPGGTQLVLYIEDPYVERLRLEKMPVQASSGLN